MTKRREPPLNPVNDDHLASFDEFVSKWRTLLNLRDWRIVRERMREKKFMASLTSVEHEHKLAKYRVGMHFGNTPVTHQALESTALHELLHLLLRPMLDCAVSDSEHSDQLAEYEHAVITVLEELLMQAYGERDAGAQKGE